MTSPGCRRSHRGIGDIFDCTSTLPLGHAILWYALAYSTSSGEPPPTGGPMPAQTPQQPDFNNPYGYSEMEWAAQLDPAYAAARAEVRRLSVGEEGMLSVKVKELVVMGVLASRGLQYGVAAHMRRAIEYGTTKEELFEAIKAAAVPGGGVAYSVGVRALQALEQDGAFPQTSPPPVSTRRRGKAAKR